MTPDKCKKCGTLLAETDMFCMHCGQKRQINEISQEESQKQEPPRDVEEGLKCVVCDMNVQLGDVFCGECGTRLMNHSGKDNENNAPPAGASLHVENRNGANHSRRIVPIVVVVLLVLIVAGSVIYKTQGSNDVETQGASNIAAPDAKKEITETSVKNAAVPHVPKIPTSEVEESDMPIVAQEMETEEIAWSASDASGYSAVQIRNNISGQISDHWLPGVITGDRVNFRSHPNTNAKVLTQFNKGDRLVVLGRLSRNADKYPWYRVEYGGQIGWLYGQFLMVYDL